MMEGLIAMKKKNWYTSHVTLWIFIGLVAGIVFGLIMPGRFEWALPVINLVSSLYMNALRMMIFPLVFCSIVMGIQGIGSVGKTGKVGGQTLLYYCGTTLFASLLGLFLPKLLNIGNGKPVPMPVMDPNFLVICGSVNPITVAQCDYAEEEGFQRIRLHPEQKLDPAYWDSREETLY